MAKLKMFSWLNNSTAKSEKTLNRPAPVVPSRPRSWRSPSSGVAAVKLGDAAMAATGKLSGYTLSDFPPGMGNMPSLPTLEGRPDPYCDWCGKKSDYRMSDPILIIATNPKNAEDRWYWNRALCSGCYSKRFDERYPGVSQPATD